MLGNLNAFNCRLLIFNFFKKKKYIFRNTIRVYNGLDPDQNRRSVGLGLDQNVCKDNKQMPKS